MKPWGFPDEEDRLICRLFAISGSRWSVIGAHLPGRTDNETNNYYRNTKLKRKHEEGGLKDEDMGEVGSGLGNGKVGYRGMKKKA
ncbi:hypothetical protein CUMW_184070 [Citrus unshiu]|uniref:Uncharacterized protein n=1 Tax=Citrus unshiu TaxID=55188 RepID=A0A2H5Q075_CITUN|nr:hypothetical protein CUMW_184070 [Citrus unshiu]